MNTLILSGLKITGPITNKMPVCVIIEIARTLSINYDKNRIDNLNYIMDIIDTINNIPETKIQTINRNIEYNDSQLTIIARFVNSSSKVQWKKIPLIKAFKHLITFYKTDIPPLPTEKWIEGAKTPDNPYTYNSMMLYSLCLYYSIPTNRNTTLEDMAQCVRLFNEDTSVIRENLLSIINVLPKTSLIALLTSPLTHITPGANIKLLENSYKYEDKNSIPSIDPTKLDILLMNEADKSLTDPSTLSRVKPISQYESIILAARVYGINLTECKNPFKEYTHMRKYNNITINQYIPIDVNFKNRYVKNVDFFDVRKNYAHKIPSLYTNEDLVKFARQEGYEDRDFYNDTPLNLLHITRLVPTFHLGRHPDSNNDTTLITLDNISDIDPKRIITYGIIDSKELLCYDINELKDNMLANKSFVLPNNPKERFNQNSIRKLKNICKNFLPTQRRSIENISAEQILRRTLNFITNMANSNNPNYINNLNNLNNNVNYNINIPNEITTDYKNLLDAIELVEQYDIATSDYANKLRIAYRESDEKDKFVNILTNLFHCGCYMRSWKVGTNEYPITSIQCTYDISLQGQIDLNVTNSIKKYENSILELNKNSEIFNNLPLMKLLKDNEKFRFQASNCIDNGYTVNDRLNIVKSGEGSNSCIRISSNYLMYTAYYFMLAINLSPPFDIFTMNEIS